MKRQSLDLLAVAFVVAIALASASGANAASLPTQPLRGTVVSSTATSLSVKTAGVPVTVHVGPKSKFVDACPGSLARVQTGAIDRAQLADEYNQALSDDTLQKAQTELGALGEPSTFDFEGKAVRGNITAYVYRVKFAQGADLDEMIAFDDTNKIVRMIFSLRHPNGAVPAPSLTST
jgi:hypothetical protein